MKQTVDYYKVLQVHRGAGRDDITAAYRRLCKLYHPDINASPDAEELMKQINIAYSALLKNPVPGTAGARGSHDVDMQAAARAVEMYFNALLAGDYIKAYNYISNHDKKYVTYQSFCDWRKAVQRLFAMREFSVRGSGSAFAHKITDGAEVLASKITVSITEKNTATQALEKYSIKKLVVLETGGWKIFLGYRDLSEIAKVFEDLSARQEHGEMAKHWNEYCSTTCRDLNMLNLRGFLSRSEAELYRHKRYKQQMTVACFYVKPASASVSFELTPEAVEIAAKTIVDSLRETDIPAYLGGGMFAVLFVELKKRHAEIITQRIVNRLKTNVHKSLKVSVHAACKFQLFEGGNLAEYVEKCSKFI